MGRVLDGIAKAKEVGSFKDLNVSPWQVPYLIRVSRLEGKLITLADAYQAVRSFGALYDFVKIVKKEMEEDELAILGGECCIHMCFCLS